VTIERAPGRAFLFLWQELLAVPFNPARVPVSVILTLAQVGVICMSKIMVTDFVNVDTIQGHLPGLLWTLLTVLSAHQAAA